MDLIDQGEDAIDRGTREDAVAEVKDMARPTGCLVENPTHPTADLGLGGEENRRVEVPLNRLARAEPVPG